MIKRFMAFFYAFCFAVNLYGQNCPLEGEIFNAKEIKIETRVCFKREVNVDQNINAYHTKYVISSISRKELYNIDFYYFNLYDSIFIKYKEILTGESIPHFINIDTIGSKIMFKDYQANDTTINLIGKYSILFTIPDISKPYITLNQFRLIENPDNYMILNEIDNSLWKKHLEEAKAYLIAKKEAEDNDRQQKVDKLINKMNVYKEKVLKISKQKDSTYFFKKPLIATGEMQNDFKKKITDIIKGSFKNIFPYKEIDNDIYFTFFCGSNGKIDTAKTDFIKNDLLGWFVDSFKTIIYPIIETDIFKTRIERIYTPDLSDEFNELFQDNIAQIKPIADSPQWDTINRTRKNIDSLIEMYSIKDINIPTIYNFRLSYKSTVKTSTYKYKKNKDGPDEITELKVADPISEELKIIFKNKIVVKDITKYNIKICSVFIDKILLGHDMKPDPKE